MERKELIAELVTSECELYTALAQLVKWMDDSKLSHTPSVGVYPFVTEPVEYSVVKDARKALENAQQAISSAAALPATPANREALTAIAQIPASLVGKFDK